MKLVYGFGINDANYKVSSYLNGKQILCPYYKTWKNMLKRCFCKSESDRLPTYSECVVVDEWLHFSSFKSWMEKQDWEGKYLDKDILHFRNKLYSPETCCFVDRKTNQFVVESDATRGKYLIGCYFETSMGKFKAQCRDSNGKVVNLGRYETQESAHYTWLSFKYKQAVILASKQTDVMVADALINRYTRENYPHGTTHMYATGNPYNDVGESQPVESVPSPATSQTIVDF